MEFNVDRSRAILLVMDMQKLFTVPSSPYGNDATEMIAPLNEILEQVRVQGIPVVHSIYQLQKDGSQSGLRTDWPQIEQGYFDPVSPWSQIDARVDVAESDYQLTRTRPGAFFDGMLAELMKKLAKDQIILCGLSTNYAISFTVHEAFSRDIPAVLVDDLIQMTAFEDRSKKEFLHATLGMWACEVATQASILARVESAVPAPQ